MQKRILPPVNKKLNRLFSKISLTFLTIEQLSYLFVVWGSDMVFHYSSTKGFHLSVLVLNVGKDLELPTC